MECFASWPVTCLLFQWNSFSSSQNALQWGHESCLKRSKLSCQTANIPEAASDKYLAICSSSTLILSAPVGPIHGFESIFFFFYNYSFTPQMDLNGFSWHSIDPSGVNWSLLCAACLQSTQSQRGVVYGDILATAGSKACTHQRVNNKQLHGMGRKCFDIYIC